MEDPVAISVRRDGEAMPLGEATEQEEVAVGLLLVAKDASEHFTGGVIDRAVEDKAGAAVLEPGMLTAIHLDEEAGLWHALPPAAVLGRSARARTAEAGFTQEALDGGPGEL